MKLSCIIPAHNEAANIHKALESVYAQSFKDYECIVVCDACEDATEEIAKSYGAKTISVNAHCDGLARNAGIEASEGEWLLFLDADDWWLHEFVFELLTEKIDSTKADIIIFSIIWKHIGYVGARSKKGTLYPHCTNKCWKKSFIGDTRFPDKYVANDASFHELMMAKSPIIAEFDAPLYYYNYLRKGSKSDIIGRTIDNTKLYWSTH